MNDQEENINSEEKAGVESTARKTNSKFKMGPKRTVRILGTVIAIVLIALLVKSGNFEEATVATVNGEKISQADFDSRIELVLASSNVSGIDVGGPGFRAQLEEQVLNELINTTLILQGAKDAGIEADKEETERQYQNIVAQFGSEAAILDALGQNGVTLEGLKQNIEEQIMINAFIDLRIGSDGITVSEEEIVALYDREAALQDNMPALEEIHSQLNEQLVSEKTQQLALALIGQLREVAVIEFPTEDEVEDESE